MNAPSLDSSEESSFYYDGRKPQPLATPSPPLSPQQTEDCFGSSSSGLFDLSDSPPGTDCFTYEEPEFGIEVGHNREVNKTGKKRLREAVNVDPAQRAEKKQRQNSGDGGGEEKKLTRGLR